MYSFVGTKLNQLSVLLVLTFFMVLILHPVISHDHPSELFGGVSSSLHTTLAERVDVIPFMLLFISIIFAAPYTSSIQHALLRGTQNVNIPLLLPLRHALAQGILHSKAY